MSVEETSRNLTSINLAHLHQTSRDGNRATYLEIDTILQGEKEICRMNSCDYLGLNSDRNIREDTVATIRSYGTGRDGNAALGGETHLHLEVERRLCEIYGAEACMITPNGTLSNLNVMQSLVASGLCDVFLSDVNNHATIISGMQLGRVVELNTKIVTYGHLDYEELEQRLKKFAGSKIVIVSDGIFSMEGTIANSKRLLELAERYDALLVLDECHSFGIIGRERGGGSLEWFGSAWTQRVVITGTFGKAVPCNGGYIMASRALIDRVFRFGRFSLFCGTMTPSDCGTAISSLEVIREGRRRREALYRLVKLWRALVYKIYRRYHGDEDKWSLFYKEQLDSPSPIVPFYFNLPGVPSLKLYEFCIKMIRSHRLYVSPILFPAVRYGDELIRTLVTVDADEDQLKMWAVCLEEEYRRLVTRSKL